MELRNDTLVTAWEGQSRRRLSQFTHPAAKREHSNAQHRLFSMYDRPPGIATGSSGYGDAADGGIVYREQVREQSLAGKGRRLVAQVRASPGAIRPGCAP
jgi:hypothetical protein